MPMARGFHEIAHTHENTIATLQNLIETIKIMKKQKLIASLKERKRKKNIQ
jgi:hypothetical protein